jgi:hypothetical protein
MPRSDTMTVAGNGKDTATARSEEDPCGATLYVRRYGRFSCKKAAGHAGPHEADDPGRRWVRVIWL